MNGLLDFLQGASNSAASNVSAPVDGLAWLLRKAGLPIPANPIGGSDWMAEKGLTAQPKNRNMGLLGEAFGGVAPIVAAAKAPQIAKGLLALDDKAMDVTRRGIEGYMDSTGMRQNIFIGPNAKTWDKAAATKAQELADAGTDARQIWSETGTWKGPDGKWRQEIPDNLAQITSGNISADQMRAVNGGEWIRESDFLTKYASTPEAKAIRTRASMRNGGVLNDDTPRLFDTLSHNRLADAYPELGQIRVALDDKMPMGNAAFAEGNNAIVMSPMKDADALSSKLHEVQHAIQNREGFSRGGAPGANGLTWSELSGEGRKIYENSRNHYDDPILRDIFEGSAPLKPWDEMTAISRTPYIEQAQEGAYRRLAGEAEARAVEKRLPLDAAQRRALFPEDSYDVPINQLIIRGLL
jgi:hypothetical protein